MMNEGKNKKTYYSNRNVERNKTPLKNIYYEIEIIPIRKDTPEDYKKYIFKDLGYILLYWGYEEKDPIKQRHGYITVDELKERIGEKQYSKFCQGKRKFIIQRRIDGKNIPLRER